MLAVREEGGRRDGVDPRPEGGRPRHLAAGKKSEVSTMFGRIATRYDLANTMLSLGQDRMWRRALSRVLLDGLSPDSSKVERQRSTEIGLTILDFCAGTGAQSLDLAREGARRGIPLRVIASDLSWPMVQQLGRLKEGGRGHWRRYGPMIFAAQADAESPPLKEESVDGAAVSFGIRNVDRYRHCLRSVHRTLRPGGLLAVLEFSLPAHGPLRRFFLFYFSRVLPLVGRLFFDQGGAYAYLPASVARFPRGPGFMSVLESCGFISVEQRRLCGGLVTLYFGKKLWQRTAGDSGTKGDSARNNRVS